MGYLDTVLPKGSHVLLTGLANGSVLYDLMSDRYHPLGRVKNDIRFSDMYDFLSCLQVISYNLCGKKLLNDEMSSLLCD